MRRFSPPRKWVWGALAALTLAVLLAALATRGGDESSAASGGPGPAAPELSGTDPVTGKAVSLADFAGKPVVINVWASWCPGCNEEAADLRTFAERHPEAQVLGIDFQDTEGGARDFYSRWKWTHPSIFDPDGELTGRLGLQGLPTTYFLDAEHRVVTRIVGETTLAGFEDGLRQATGAPS